MITRRLSGRNKWVSAFVHDSVYDEAMCLGAEYRKSQSTAEEVDAFERGCVIGYVT